MCLNKLSSVGHKTHDASCDNGQLKCELINIVVVVVVVVPIFILEMQNQTNKKCLPKFVQMDNASSSIKTAIANDIEFL